MRHVPRFLYLISDWSSQARKPRLWQYSFSERRIYPLIAMVRMAPLIATITSFLSLPIYERAMQEALWILFSLVFCNLGTPTTLCNQGPYKTASIGIVSSNFTRYRKVTLRRTHLCSLTTTIFYTPDYGRIATHLYSDRIVLCTWDLRDFPFHV